MACKQNLYLGCVLISDPSTLGAGAKTRLESRIKKFTAHTVFAARKGGIIPGLYFSNIDWYRAASATPGCAGYAVVSANAVHCDNSVLSFMPSPTQPRNSKLRQTRTSTHVPLHVYAEWPLNRRSGLAVRVSVPCALCPVPCALCSVHCALCPVYALAYTCLQV